MKKIENHEWEFQFENSESDRQHRGSTRTLWNESMESFNLILSLF